MNTGRRALGLARCPSGERAGAGQSARPHAALFRATADTLLTFGRDPRHLGGTIGVTAILHTWGQNLSQHLYLHCVVTGGALAPDGTRWIAARAHAADLCGPAQVLEYLGRYTHRVAISNARLVDLHDGLVQFRWRDYADHDRPKVMALSAEEFLRRFLLHVVPRGFVRIRYFGLLANRRRHGLRLRQQRRFF